MEIPNNILFIFLGSILTFLSSWLVETLKNKGEREEKASLFKLSTKQELKVIRKGLEKLKSNLSSKNYFDYYVLSRLDKGVANLEGIKREATYLTSLEQQEKFIDLISDLSSYLTEVRGLQDLYYGELSKIKNAASPSTQQGAFKDLDELNTFFNNSKTEKSIDMLDLKRRIDDFLKEV